MKLSELIRKREVATATVATPATVAPVMRPSVATVASVAVANINADTACVATPDCIDTLETDYAELKTFIAELCRIVGHHEEAKERMLAACRNITPAEISGQRDYFRQQVEMATAGKYWTGKATH